MERPELWMDSENGGLDAKVHSPLQFAFLAVKNNVIVDRLKLEIRQEPFVLTIEAMKTNKIDITTPGLSFKQAKEKYEQFMTRNFFSVVIDRGTKNERLGYDRPNRDNMPFFCGHNTFYDRPFLHRVLGTDFDFCYYHRLDTMVLANSLKAFGKLPGLSNGRLETLSDYFGFPKLDAHDAMRDIERTREIFVCLGELMNGKSVDQIRREMEIQPSLFDRYAHITDSRALAAQAH